MPALQKISDESAGKLKVVKVDFCDDSAASVGQTAGSDANVGRLQAFLQAQTKVREGLRSQGYTAKDVVAADHDGNVLIVYVI